MALVQVSAAWAGKATLEPLAPPRAAAARSHREGEGASEVQDEVSRREVAGVRASPGPPRRRGLLALRRRDRRVETGAIWSTGQAEEVLGPLDRDRVDTSPCFPVAVAPSGGLLAVGPGLDGHRPRGGVSHHTLATESAAKHGRRGKCGWKKLHLGVDRCGVIVAQAVTEPTADDATTGIGLLEKVDGDVASVTADTAYDTVAFYEAAGGRGATVVVPPAKTASVSRRRPRSSARDRTIKRVKVLGRRRWKKASGYQRRARVENAIFRYKSIIGGGLRDRTPGGRQSETLLACHVLNRMTELGRPVSYSIGC